MGGEDYQNKYYEASINSLKQLINSNQKLLDEKLEAIYSQTKKTNGTVIQHEKRIRSLEDNELEFPVKNIVEKVEKMNKAVEDVKYFKNNPKMLRLVIKGALVGGIGGFVGLIITILKLFNVGG